VTYFEGDLKNGLAPDDEARQIWLDQDVAEDHILTGNAKDNFWGTCVFMCTGAASKPDRRRNGRNWTMWTLQVRRQIFILF
jgi:alanyl-tRNA synthetase